jgi:hypothetical protein
VDRQDFPRTLAETCLKTGFAVHAYCLMRNHWRTKFCWGRSPQSAISPLPLGGCLAGRAHDPEEGPAEGGRICCPGATMRPKCRPQRRSQYFFRKPTSPDLLGRNQRRSVKRLDPNHPSPGGDLRAKPNAPPLWRRPRRAQRPDRSCAFALLGRLPIIT